VNGRLATEDDFDAGVAAFFSIDGTDCTAHPNPGLPALVGFVPGTFEGDRLEFDFSLVVQMEHNAKGGFVVVGHIWPDGVRGMALLTDVQWIKFVSSSS
ncbi:MAG: hypothetical protein JNJ84_02775, partial [Rhodobacteraceae bacterium]|nr:hypothetical protein [Paracoccaceae bacterium]